VRSVLDCAFACRFSTFGVRCYFVFEVGDFTNPGFKAFFGIIPTGMHQYMDQIWWDWWWIMHMHMHMNMFDL
jgi:hypothetical protein